MFSKTVQLLSVLSHRPKEAFQRTTMIITSRLQSHESCSSAYAIRSADDARAELSLAISDNLDKRLQECGLEQIETAVRGAQMLLPANAPFRARHNGDFQLARLCYLVARALKPDTIVETGVCYGVTSAFVLQALKENGNGHLHSIDLPPLAENADAFVGRFIPSELRAAWTLHRGTAAACLSPLLKKIGPVGMFIHDSLHTYANMRFEFSTAWPALKPGGVLVSDDVHNNRAFLELSLQADVAYSAVMKEEESKKNNLFGVAVKSLSSELLRTRATASRPFSNFN